MVGVFKVNAAKISSVGLQEMESLSSVMNSKENHSTINKTNIICEVCGFSAERYCIYIKHLSNHKLKNCNICARSFSTIYQLRRHKNSVHLKKSSTKESKLKISMCDVCGFVPESYGSYRQHIQQHLEKSCDICHISFKTMPHLRRHKQHVHSAMINNFSCETCGKSFKLVEALKLHVKRTHMNNTSRLNCNICGKSFKNKQTLKSHKYVAHTVDQCVCELCRKPFKNQVHLSNHIKIHRTEGSICEICGKNVKGLFSHMKIVHSKRDSASCDICGKVYSSERNLKYHKRNVHGNKEKDNVCHICGAAFQLRDTLKHHFFTHSEERKHTCSICGKTFKLMSVLKTHQRVHSAAEPYNCSACGETFRWKQTFDKHYAKCVQTIKDT